MGKFVRKNGSAKKCKAKSKDFFKSDEFYWSQPSFTIQISELETEPVEAGWILEDKSKNKYMYVDNSLRSSLMDARWNAWSEWKDLQEEEEEDDLFIKVSKFVPTPSVQVSSSSTNPKKNISVKPCEIRLERCDNYFQQLKSTVNHFDSTNEEMKNNVVAAKKVLCRHRCPLCPQKFSTMKTRDEHLTTFHRINLDEVVLNNENDNRNNQNLTSVVVKKKANFRPKVLNNISNLTKTEKVLNGQRGKPYSCTKCTREFMSYWKLKAHNVCHVGVKLFKCKVCNERFASRWSLKRHGVRAHKNQK